MGKLPLSGTVFGDLTAEDDAKLRIASPPKKYRNGKNVD